MAKPVIVPRVNNNDDQVTLVRLAVKLGEKVSANAVVAEIETEKAAVDVVADCDGIVVEICAEIGGQVPVGSPLFWLGESIDDLPPARRNDEPSPKAEPTAKVRMLLRQHGLTADEIPFSGERLTEADLRAFLASRPVDRLVPIDDVKRKRSPQMVGGTRVDLTPHARAMMKSVAQQRIAVAPTYMEIVTSSAPWDEVADNYKKERGLLVEPRLALMAHRLVEAVSANPLSNGYAVDGDVYLHDCINLGFTVQVGVDLFLVVVRDAGALSRNQFVDKLSHLQRRAFARRLTAEESSGATVVFSSMARWNISCHIPVLAPNTGLAIGHAAPSSGPTQGNDVFGATYDHGLLTGFAVAEILQALSNPQT